MQEQEFYSLDDYSSSSSSSSYCQAWELCATIATTAAKTILTQQQQELGDELHHHDSHPHPPRELIVIREFGPEGESRGYADDATWILTASFVILTMQSGFGLLEAGSCSQGYEVNIMMKNLVDVAFGSLAYYLIGYGISFGIPSCGFMGLGDMPAVGNYDEVDSGLLYSRYIFQLSFAATSTTIVSGCVAQRLRFFVYVVYSFFAVIFYSFCAHWVFDTGGWLNQLGVHDFAGAGPVHLFGGINGLIGILFVGPRTGRFDNSRPISDFFPSSPLSQIMGLFMLLWGWIGFNCGSTFGITDDKWVVGIRTAVTTINSVAGGAIISIGYSLYRTHGIMVIPEHVINGILASLVSITPACACVRTYVAFPIGIIGAFFALIANTIICNYQLDDPVGGVGHHGISAMWGLIAVGLFADNELPGINVLNGLFKGGGFELLKLQLLEIIAITGWSIMWSSSFFYIAGVVISRDWKNPRLGLRVSHHEEERGADWFLHGVVDMEAVAEELEFSITNLFGGDGNLGSEDFDRKRSHHDPAFFRSTSIVQQHQQQQNGKGVGQPSLKKTSKLNLLRHSSVVQTPTPLISQRIIEEEEGDAYDEDGDDENDNDESTIEFSSFMGDGGGALPSLEENEEPSIHLSMGVDEHDVEEGMSTNTHQHPGEVGVEPSQHQHQESNLLRQDNSMSHSMVFDSLSSSNSNMLRRSSLPRAGLRLLLAEARLGSSRRIQMLQRQQQQQNQSSLELQQPQQQRPISNRRGMLRHHENSRHLAQMYK